MTFNPSELLRLHEAATPGEWATIHPQEIVSHYEDGYDTAVASVTVTETAEDAALIVYLHSHAEEIIAGMEFCEQFVCEECGGRKEPMDNICWPCHRKFMAEMDIDSALRGDGE